METDLWMMDEETKWGKEHLRCKDLKAMPTESTWTGCCTPVFGAHPQQSGWGPPCPIPRGHALGQGKAMSTARRVFTRERDRKPR